MYARPGQHGERSERLIICFTLKSAAYLQGFPVSFRELSNSIAPSRTDSYPNTITSSHKQTSFDWNLKALELP